MKNYIFINEKTKEIIAEEDWYLGGEKAKGYLEALQKRYKKIKIVAYCKLGGQD